MIADDAHGFTETLEVNDLTGTQEADRIYNIGIFYHTKNIIIGGAGFLLRRASLSCPAGIFVRVPETRSGTAQRASL